MKSIIYSTILALTIGCTAWAQQSATPSIRSLPASVVKTVPQCGEVAVDPNLKEIKVTFSKDMQTSRWSVCQISKETFPEVAGSIHFQDDRTCVIPVKLEPNKTYVLWFNQPRFTNFRDKQNNASVPYQLVFQTKAQAQ